MAIQHKIMTIVGAKKSSVKNKMRCCLFDWKWNVYCLEIKKNDFPLFIPQQTEIIFNLLHWIKGIVVFLLLSEDHHMTLFYFQVVPSAPVMGDTDYSDPFDARLDPCPETTQSQITPENNGYMEPYEAQKVITGQSDFVLFLLVCAPMAQRSLVCSLSRMERMKCECYECVFLSNPQSSSAVRQWLTADSLLESHRLQFCVHAVCSIVLFPLTFATYWFERFYLCFKT